MYSAAGCIVPAMYLLQTLGPDLGWFTVREYEDETTAVQAWTELSKDLKRLNALYGGHAECRLARPYEDVLYGALMQTWTGTEWTIEWPWDD